MKQVQRKGAVRARNKDTQGKILRAATKVFAEHGFREATTRMICAEAGVNVALVNYYFRSKAELYKAVIASLFEDVAKPMLRIPESVHDERSWHQAVRAWVVRSLEICSATRPPDYYVARLMGMEECLPSEMAQDIRERFAMPMRQCFSRLLRMAMTDDDPVSLRLWMSTVSAQYVIYAIAKPSWTMRFCPPELDDQSWLKRVGEHICEDIFSRLRFQRVVE